MCVAHLNCLNLRNHGDACFKCWEEKSLDGIGGRKAKFSTQPKSTETPEGVPSGSRDAWERLTPEGVPSGRPTREEPLSHNWNQVASGAPERHFLALAHR